MVFSPSVGAHPAVESWKTPPTNRRRGFTATRYIAGRTDGVDRGVDGMIVVPGAGIEPARCCHRGILSPLRLPVSPPGQTRRNCTEAVREDQKGRIWRLSPESNRGPRLCRPLHNHSATQPLSVWRARTEKTPGFPEVWRSRTHEKFGAGNEIRTRDPNLGKVVLYQLSYSRVE